MNSMVLLWWGNPVTRMSFEELVGGRTKESAEYYCDAELIPEPDNAFDVNAVFVCVSGEKVGYLPRKTAADTTRPG
jgi:hypothetical protein